MARPSRDREKTALWLDRDVLNLLRERQRETGVPMAEQIRRLLREGIELQRIAESSPGTTLKERVS